MRLPLELQAKLLRVLESGTFERLGSSRTVKVNVRLVVPDRGISNPYSYLPRASTALSATLTACSSLLAVVTIPAFAVESGQR